MIPEDDGNDLMHTFFNPDKEGWLWKQGEWNIPPLSHFKGELVLWLLRVKRDMKD